MLGGFYIGECATQVRLGCDRRLDADLQLPLRDKSLGGQLLVAVDVEFGGGHGNSRSLGFLIRFPDFVVRFQHTGACRRHGSLHQVPHFTNAFVELFCPGDGGFPGFLQSFFALLKKSEQIGGHKTRVVIVQFENDVTLLDADAFENMPFLDAARNLGLDILRAFIGGIRRQLTGHRNGLGPRHKRDDEDKETQRG